MPGRASVLPRALTLAAGRPLTRPPHGGTRLLTQGSQAWGAQRVCAVEGPAPSLWGPDHPSRDVQSQSVHLNGPVAKIPDFWK